MRLQIWRGWLMLLLLPWCAFAAAAHDPEEAKALHALLDRHWEASMRRYPEDATWYGDLRFNDQLTDASFAAHDAWNAVIRGRLTEAEAIGRDRLNASDRTSLDLFLGSLRWDVEMQPFLGYGGMGFGANGGAQSDFASLVQASPVENVLQVEQLLRRMAAYPAQVQQTLAHMRRSKALGWMPTQDVLQRVLVQIDRQLPASLEEGAHYQRFRALGAGIPAAERTRLQAEALATIEKHVAPALRSMRAFAADELLPHAPADGALRNYPDGQRVYEALVRRRTTTSLRADEIHAIGMRELTHIRAEMDAIRRETAFTGDFAAFIAHLTTDPKFFHASPEAMLTGYRDLAKRLDAEMPRLFAELPRLPYGVKAMPAHQGATAAEYYQGPALDGTRGGNFFANVLAWKTRPRWTMPTLVAHEAVPGHHLQIARSTELRDLPRFRRSDGYTAFVEGWAVYAETLGRDIGLYDDPYDRFGHLQWQALRAARLVVDTGIHSLGWSRPQSIEFLVERTGMDRGFLTQEVDRYTSWPGQALGYMIGKLKIEELREHARARLGARFDLRRFHNAVIDQGALPLDVLARVIEEWIAAEANAPAK